MKFVRKTKHYIRYLIGLILQNPKLVMQEFLGLSEKIKKLNIKKNHYIVWICSLPKSGSTLIEEIIGFYPYVKLDRSLKRFFSKEISNMFMTYHKKCLSLLLKINYLLLKLILIIMKL